jgi:hypothetical protein
MKKIRTCLSWLLALALCLSLGCTAFASGEASGDLTDGLTAIVTNSDSITITSGERVIDGEDIQAVDGTAIQNSGDSVIVVRNSNVSGTTTSSTEPLTGNPGNLLVAGSVRTTLALGQAHSFYINSTITSQNWAALSTDGAEPVTEEGQSELSLYAYGTTAVTTEGGYGAYSDLFCNLLSYGSTIQAAEIGIITGTYGRVVVGTIADGEADPDVAQRLTEDDMALQPDKELGSTIAGGRNAIMIHSVNLPPYWEYEGYSEEELPLHSTPVTVNGSTLVTDLSLDQGIAYDAQKQAYIDHTAGSVILIKSTNTQIDLTDTQLIAGEGGTGAIIHSVYNNDTMFMNTVPEGETYPGMVINMTDMAVSGDVIDEDYQRDMYLTLTDASLTGAINYYDCAHWNEVAAAEGFTDYALDESYETVHGTYLTLTDGSAWTVTSTSTLLGLTIDETSTVSGTMTVDGVATPITAGTYEGVIVLTPASASGEASQG